MSSPRFDWAHCRSFLALLRAGSLAAAARDMGVAHPTVRRHLEELESALGAALFVRSSTGLVPTELALELREPAEAMEAAAAHLVRTASVEPGMIAGTVRITCSEVIGAEVIPPILAGLKRGHPRLSFELTLTNKIENVLRRDADIAVRMTRPTQDDLVARRIGAVPLGLYAHDSWVRANGVFASIEALIGTGAFIGYDRDPGMVRALAARGISVSQGDFGFRTDSDLAQLSAIRSGVGVGVCQIPIAARTADLQRILPDFSHDLEIWLVTHAGMRHANRVRITFDALASGLTTYLSRAEPPTTKH